MKDKISHQGRSPQKNYLNFLSNSAIGLSGMLVMNSMIFPLEVVRTRLQTAT
jgi:hypothetical protein